MEIRIEVYFREFVFLGDTIKSFKIKPNKMTKFVFRPLDKRKVECIIMHHIKISKRQHNKLENLEKNWAPKRIEQIDPSLRSIIGNIHEELVLESERILKIIRWRFNLTGKQALIKKYKLYWKCHNFMKIKPPINYNYKVGASGLINFEPFDFESRIYNHLQDINYEPIAHDILREAREILELYPRSSLILTTMSAEIGIKNFISKVSPKTSWLIENIPSPPIAKIYSEYLPEILPNFKADKVLEKELKSLVNNRNKLVHKGEFNLGLNKIDDLIRLVRKFLYFLDSQSNDWAKQYV